MRNKKRRTSKMIERKTRRRKIQLQKRKDKFDLFYEQFGTLIYTIKIKKPPVRFKEMRLDYTLIKAINHACKILQPCEWVQVTTNGFLMEAYLTDIGEIWAKFMPIKP